MNSETNNTWFESPYKELLESVNKDGVASSILISNEVLFVSELISEGDQKKQKFWGTKTYFGQCTDWFTNSLLVNGYNSQYVVSSIV